MSRKQTILTIQAATVIASSTFGVSVLSFPNAMARSAGTGAPLMTVAGILLALLGFWPLASLGRKFKGQTIFEYGQVLIGKWAAAGIHVLLLLFFTVSSALYIREFGNVLSIVVFRKTPIEVSMILILLTVAFSCRRDVVKFSYIHIFYFPFMFLPFLLLMLLSVSRIDILNLLPMMGNHPMNPIGFAQSLSLYLGTFVITVLIPHMSNPEASMKSVIYGIIASGALYLLMILSSLGIYGVQETKKLIYPTLELSRSISLGGVLERFDVLFIVVWFVTVYTTIYTSYYLASYTLSKLLNFSDLRVSSSFLFPFLLAISLIPRSVFQSGDIARSTEFVGIVLAILYPLLLKIISLFHRRRERNP
ncbi:endospore germination permease [Paenibacillus sp. M1]|uniref:Endospore germination permease n=1 Tax=Paenibacillus haidiansis TaxID=1574488 RepID=A0ABU7VT80_9BACL